MSSALLARPYLNGQWQLVEDGAQSAGRVANRREWRIARDIFVGLTPAVARQTNNGCWRPDTVPSTVIRCLWCFTLRGDEDERLNRPISARFMHE